MKADGPFRERYDLGPTLYGEHEQHLLEQFDGAFDASAQEVAGIEGDEVPVEVLESMFERVLSSIAMRMLGRVPEPLMPEGFFQRVFDAPDGHFVGFAGAIFEHWSVDSPGEEAWADLIGVFVDVETLNELGVLRSLFAKAIQQSARTIFEMGGDRVEIDPFVLRGDVFRALRTGAEDTVTAFQSRIYPQLIKDWRARFEAGDDLDL